MYIYILSAAKLIKLATAGGDDEGNLGIAEHRELVGFLEQTISSF